MRLEFFKHQSVAAKENLPGLSDAIFSTDMHFTSTVMIKIQGV